MNSDSLIWEVNDAVRPAWLKIPQAVRYSSICRSSLYYAIKSGEIRSACLRDPTHVRGTRLVNVASLDAYINRHVNLWSEPPPDKLPAGNGGENL
jgi:hypothetical protein